MSLFQKGYVKFEHGNIKQEYVLFLSASTAAFKKVKKIWSLQYICQSRIEIKLNINAKK